MLFLLNRMGHSRGITGIDEGCKRDINGTGEPIGLHKIFERDRRIFVNKRAKKWGPQVVAIR